MNNKNITKQDLKAIKKILKEVKNEYIWHTGVKQDYTINKYQTLINKINEELNHE